MSTYMAMSKLKNSLKMPVFEFSVNSLSSQPYRLSHINILRINLSYLSVYFFSILLFPGFTCPEGYDIPFKLKCDGVVHCSDSSDEKNCAEHICPEGYSIPSSLKCDKFNHCSDGSDEENCPNSAGI